MCFILLTGWLLLILAPPTWGENTLAANPPQEAVRFYQDAPLFTVAARRISSKHYPCSRCHEFMEADPTVRELKAPHPKLRHGQAQIWCLTCHNPNDYNTLRTLLDTPVSLADEHIVCAQCHALEAKDWRFGAHGKRVGNWEGQREIYSCSACHDPHRPALKPRRAEPPPAMRAGLERRNGSPPPTHKLWEQALDSLLENPNAQR